MIPVADIYGGEDPRDLAAYSIVEAAGFLRLPTTTLRQWVLGHVYSTATGKAKAQSVIVVPDGRPPSLTFWNLSEAYVLAAIRREHGVSLQSVRRALRYVAKELKVDRPLIRKQFLTDGVSLFVEKLETMQDEDAGVRSLINASAHGQMAARQLLQGALARVSRDPGGLISCLFPWVKDMGEPRRIEIDPRRAFGRPVIVNTRIPAEELSDRFSAGDSVAAIAKDFGLLPDVVQGVLQWEMARKQDVAAA